MKEYVRVHILCQTRQIVVFKLLIWHFVQYYDPFCVGFFLFFYLKLQSSDMFYVYLSVLLTIDQLAVLHLSPEKQAQWPNKYTNEC